MGAREPGSRDALVEREIPSTPLRAGSSLRLTNGSVQVTEPNTALREELRIAKIG